jgi:hypothetical protein
MVRVEKTFRIIPMTKCRAILVQGLDAEIKVEGLDWSIRKFMSNVGEHRINEQCIPSLSQIKK